MGSQHSRAKAARQRKVRIKRRRDTREYLKKIKPSEPAAQP